MSPKAGETEFCNLSTTKLTTCFKKKKKINILQRSIIESKMSIAYYSQYENVIEIIYYSEIQGNILSREKKISEDKS